MKGTSPSRKCGEVAANGIESTKMESVAFIKTVKSGKSWALSPLASIAPKFFCRAWGERDWQVQVPVLARSRYSAS